MHLTVLNRDNPQQNFPPISKALTEPDGLLAVGGCLSAPRLLNAYRQGIFPWYNEGDPILWWSPNQRLVLFPAQLQVSRSLAKRLRQELYTITFDKAFDRVMTSCALPRRGQQGTWIDSQMHAAYNELHRLGYAHSVEAWAGSALVGGLYGIAIGQVFFGESMFHTQTDASKVAFVTLVNHLKLWHYALIDCQVHSQHLVSLGAQTIERCQFAELLAAHCANSAHLLAWRS